MSKNNGKAAAASSTRFKKGQSGNPQGRPKGWSGSLAPASASAFDIIIGKTFAIMQNGVQRELTAEEALQIRTYQDAVKGNRPARREILKMIAKREKWLAAREKPRTQPIELRTEGHDPDNADEAMLVLGIAAFDETREAQFRSERRPLLLEPWSVQAALSRRRGGSRLEDKEIAEIKRCTRAPEALRWPRGCR
ncbi:MAG: DUF5681 domain-containing protein [Mesorhizobium sp.]|nr:DUF5681 domain-containing protein [Mesorhizobium sp.]